MRPHSWNFFQSTCLPHGGVMSDAKLGSIRLALACENDRLVFQTAGIVHPFSTAARAQMRGRSNRRSYFENNGKKVLPFSMSVTQSPTRRNASATYVRFSNIPAAPIPPPTHMVTNP